MEEQISSLSTSLIGAVVPIIVQFIRNKWLPCSGKAAHWLSLAVAFVCVLISYFCVDNTPTFSEIAGNMGLAVTISQVVYRQLQDKIKPCSEDPEGDTDAEP